MALEKSIIGPSGATTMYHKVQDMTYSAGSVRVRVGHYVDEASRRAGFDPVHTTRTGIQLIEKREVGNGTTAVSSFLVDKAMGGTANFEAELKLGMAETLGKIKREAEASAARAA